MRECRSGRWKSILSYGAILGALWLLVQVCGQCYPAAGQQIRETILGPAHTQIQTAFHTLTEGLADGLPIQDAVSQTVAVFREEH